MGLKRAVFLDRDGVINEVLTKRVKFGQKKKAAPNLRVTVN